MSAAIQLVNQPLINTNAVATALPNNLVEGHFNSVSRFEAAPENRLQRAIQYIAELQAEVRTLREELTRSERLNTNYEVLLRNAMVREQELRAQLASEMF
jgi:hypothetical protein